MEIRKEVPSWIIDWVNTTFTLLNEPEFIDDMFMDWAIYTDFTQSPTDKKVLILTEPPIVSILVDYKTGVTVVPVTTDCTFWDIKTKVYNLLWQKETSTNFNWPVVSKEINSMGRQVWKGKVINKLNPNKIYRAWKMYFKESSLNLRIKAGWILTEELEIADTEAKTDTTNLLWAWFTEIWGDIVQYTGKTDTEINGISWLTINHLVWETVIQLYEMPVNTDKPLSVELILKWQGTRKCDIPLDNSDTFGRYYQIIRTNERTLLKIVWLQNNDLVKVTNVINYQDMIANADLCPFPDSYGIDVLAYLVAWSLWYDKGIPNSQQHLNSGYTSLQVMYWDFNNETYVITQRIQPQSYKFNSIRRF